MSIVWTEERIATLQKLWADGKSATEISAAFGGIVSRNGIIGKVHRLGLSSRSKVSLAPPRETRVKPLVRDARRAKTKVDPVKAAEVKKIENRPAPAEIPKPLSVMLFELNHNDCRWPVSGEKASTLFCGHNVEPGCPYCPGHKRMSVGKGTESERTAHKVLKAVA